jgi:hypothetical protein
MSEMRRAVVKNADMSDEMQQDAVDVATAGLGKVWPSRLLGVLCVFYICSFISACCFLLAPPSTVCFHLWPLFYYIPSNPCHLLSPLLL